MTATTPEAVKRSKFALFLNTTPASTETWSRMGKGIVDNSLSYGASVSSETFIHEDNANNNVDSYALNLPVTQYCYKGDAIFDFIDEIRQSRKTGTECETDILLVYLYDFTTATNVDHYAAEKNKVTIQIESFGGPGGQRNQIAYNVLFNGDPTPCTVTISDGVPAIDS